MNWAIQIAVASLTPMSQKALNGISGSRATLADAVLVPGAWSSDAA